MGTFIEEVAAGDTYQLGKDARMSVTPTGNMSIAALTLDGTDITDKLKSLDSIATVANKSGGDFVAGALVYISGYDTTLGADIVSLADADDPTKKATLVLTAAIANNASGTAESIAIVTGLNTNSFSAVGSLVYESTTAGEWTHTAPTDADDDKRVVGVVKVKSATIGEISFFPGRAGLEHAAVYLNNLVAGILKANGAVVVDVNKHQDVLHTASLNLGATGATVPVTATGAEINRLDDSAEVESVTAAGAASVTKFNTNLNVASGGAVTLAACPASMVGKIKTIRMATDDGDVTISLANVQGGTAATTATFDDIGEELVLVGSAGGKWTVIKEFGVTLS
jgi:hypothetical protein